VIAFLSYSAGKNAGLVNDAISITAQLKQKAAVKESAIGKAGYSLCAENQRTFMSIRI
jgi:hypothetical protein